jgi:hypothetical protein
MKKLVFLFAAVLLTAISENTFAQSTGTTPAPGATHSYFVTDNPNTSVEWVVTKGTLTDTTDAVTIVSASADTTDIVWADSVSVGDWYYVHVTETDDATGCTNNKILPVQITASPFYLTLLASADDQCYSGAVTASIDLSDPTIIKYDHGNAIIEFTVTPTGLSNAYSGYSFDLDIAYGSYTGLSETVDFSSNGAISGTKVTVTDNLPVTITYTVDNTTLFTNVTDPDGDAADFIATATISGGKATNGVSDNTNGTYTDDTNVARPHTSGIGTN